MMTELGLREIISSRHAPDRRTGRMRGAKAMLAEVAAVVSAPQETVSGVYAEYENWPRLFPTISAVRLVGLDGPRVRVEVDHIEGKVANELILRCPDEIELWETKRLYDACFHNRFVPVPDGTLFVVVGEVWLKGWARLARPLLAPYMRRQMRRLQLQPVEAEAEARAGRTSTHRDVGGPR